MNLQTKSEENMKIILNKLANLLDVANHSLFDPKHYDLEKYSHLKQLHDMIVKKGKLSMMETQAFIDELRLVRKS